MASVLILTQVGGPSALGDRRTPSTRLGGSVARLPRRALPDPVPRSSRRGLPPACRDADRHRRLGATSERVAPAAWIDKDGLYPLDPLNAAETAAAAEGARAALAEAIASAGGELRFNSVALREPPKMELAAWKAGVGPKPARLVDVCVVLPGSGRAHEVALALPSGGGAPEVVSSKTLPADAQPLLSPADCELAEEVAKGDARVAELLAERYGITDLALVAADPWSVHVSAADWAPLGWRDDGVAPRLVQTFLYLRHDADDNHYAHPVSRCPPPPPLPLGAGSQPLPPSSCDRP